MNIFEDEIVDFMNLLNKNGVRSILVGGLAVNYYGYARSTGDVDLWIEDSIDNRQRLVNSFKEYGITGAEAFLTHPLVAGYAEVLLNNGIYLDLMANLVAIKQNEFDDCFRLAEKFQMTENTEVNVLHINKLIEEKTKSGRPKDIDDAIQLKMIVDSRKNNSN